MTASKTNSPESLLFFSLSGRLVCR